MPEREPKKETIDRGELFFLWHPDTKDTFSGYGLTMQPGRPGFLAGILMVDRPRPADPEWLDRVEATFGLYRLVPMTAAGERGIVCQMHVVPESQAHLRRFPSDKAAALQTALEPLLVRPPNPVFRLRWDEDSRFWRSDLAPPAELSPELREVFERTGYGCLAVESNIGIVHVCHAANADIESFADKPVWSQWQLIRMPTAPLIRLSLTIVDHPDNPYRFESFLNVAEPDQLQTLNGLVGQEELYLAFYGDELAHRFTKIIGHGAVQRQQLQELITLASRYWEELPADKRDFDRAKAEFMSRFV